MKSADLTIGATYAYAPWRSADLSDPRCERALLLNGPGYVAGYTGNRCAVGMDDGKILWVRPRDLHGTWAEHLAERERIVRQAEEAAARVEQMHLEIGRWVAATNERLVGLGLPERAGTPRGYLGIVLESPDVERLLALAEAGLRATTKEQTMPTPDESQAAPEYEAPGLTPEQEAELTDLAREGGADPEPTSQELYAEHSRQAAAGEVDR